MSALQLYVFLQVAVNCPKSLLAHAHTFFKKKHTKVGFEVTDYISTNRY